MKYSRISRAESLPVSASKHSQSRIASKVTSLPTKRLHICNKDLRLYRPTQKGIRNFASRQINRPDANLARTFMSHLVEPPCTAQINFSEYRAIHDRIAEIRAVGVSLAKIGIVKDRIDQTCAVQASSPKLPAS